MNNLYDEAQKAYDKGYEDGVNDTDSSLTYDEGYQTGWEEGRQAGYDEGIAQADDMYEEGFADGEASMNG